MKELVLAGEALRLRGEVDWYRPAGGEIVQRSLRDAAGAGLPARLNEDLLDDERRAPGIGEPLLLTVLLGLLIPPEGQLLGADVLRPVVRQLFQRPGGFLQTGLRLGLLL